MALALPIYLDNQATTPLDPRVLAEMMPYLTSEFGNAASRNHAFGWRAEAAVETARKQVAQLIGATEKEIVFTSGATESDNLAIKGVAESYKDKGDHIVTTRIEHKAVLDTCQHLERYARELSDELQGRVTSETLGPRFVTPDEGAKVGEDQALKRWQCFGRRGAHVTYCDVGTDGRVDPESVRQAITRNTIVVSVMFVNNEIGTIQPIERIGAICRERGVLFHCDAVQGLGKVPFHVDRMNVDLASISAHKMYGPKGVGALYVRCKPRVRLTQQVDGGGHERGMRSGTLNVAAIVGFGKACEIARLEMRQEAERVLGLRESLRNSLMEGLDMVALNGSLEHRLPGNLNMSFAFADAEALMIAMKEDVAVSSGSACTSASLEPSYVLRACGVDEELAHSSIRFGIGRFNTEEEIRHVSRLIVEKVRILRDMHPNVPEGSRGKNVGSVT